MTIHPLPLTHPIPVSMLKGSQQWIALWDRFAANGESFYPLSDLTNEVRNKDEFDVLSQVVLRSLDVSNDGYLLNLLDIKRKEFIIVFRSVCELLIESVLSHRP